MASEKETLQAMHYGEVQGGASLSGNGCSTGQDNSVHVLNPASSPWVPRHHRGHQSKVESISSVADLMKEHLKRQEFEFLGRASTIVQGNQEHTDNIKSGDGDTIFNSAADSIISVGPAQPVPACNSVDPLPRLNNLELPTAPSSAYGPTISATETGPTGHVVGPVFSPSLVPMTPFLSPSPQTDHRPGMVASRDPALAAANHDMTGGQFAGHPMNGSGAPTQFPSFARDTFAPLHLGTVTSAPSNALGFSREPTGGMIRDIGPMTVREGNDPFVASTPFNPNLACVAVSPMSSQPVNEWVRRQRSDMLNRLTSQPSGLPSFDAAMNNDNFPFIVTARQTCPSGHGVVKLKNIPFSTRRTEIIAFLGRNSRILNDADEPVHIIMERVTSKTQDAYVEFQTMDDAISAVDRHEQYIAKGKAPRLGDRPVQLELSSQASLMRDLFPVATGIVWNGNQARINPPEPTQTFGRFKGFVSEEEMVMLVKHVEVPNRSPYAKDCPQRPFECLISTLKKLPWSQHEHITVGQRNAIHQATVELTRHLWYMIRDGRDEVNLNRQLLRRLVTAAMTCPGFSTLQKDNIAYLMGMDELEERAYGQPRFASSWRHVYALGPKPGIPLDVIEWYIAMIREETCRHVSILPIQMRSEVENTAGCTDGYFGFLWFELLEHRGFGPSFDNMTLKQLADQELHTIEQILRRALAGPPS